MIEQVHHPSNHQEAAVNAQQITERSPVPAHLASPQGQPGATEPQKNFIHTLLNDRDLSASDKVEATDDAGYEQAISLIRARVDSLTKAQASEWITCLKAFPFKGKRGPSHRAVAPSNAEATNMPGPDVVPAGRYALRIDGVVKFYKVDRPTEGKWAGYTFVKAGKGGPHGDPDWVRVERNMQVQVVRAIAEAPAEAAKLYGQEIGSCGVCGRTLTDETSRAYGIGPVCREATGW